MSNHNRIVAGQEAKDLLARVSELKRELLNLRFQKVSGEVTNTARFRQVRVEIARLYTKLSQHKRGY